MKQGDYYTLLNVSVQADEKSIRQSYHRLAHKYHPDKNPSNTEAEEHFKRIKEAYETLIDPERRAIYDQKRSNTYIGSSFQDDYSYSIEVHIDKLHCFYGEELLLTYSYTGEGRFFKKPELNGFHISGKPFVNFHTIQHHGKSVRRTELKYVISPIQTGMLQIAPASIRINNVLHITNPLLIRVSESKCFFMPDKTSNGNPCIVHLHYHNKYTHNKVIRTELQNHSLIIPRCSSAEIIHDHGRIIKLGSTLVGFALFTAYSFDALAGMLCGNLLGGGLTNLYYALRKCKNRWYAINQFPLLKHYRELQYNYGKHTGSQVFNHRFIYFIKQALT